MTSHPHPTTMPPSTIPDDNNEEEHTEDSSSQSSTPSITSPQFPLFAALPPELRHHIWRLAVPSPGINFFNVHCIPNDHEGCNKSTSPPWVYLDLRRLSIEDSDADVSYYDPSTWQARLAVRQSCREARDIGTVPASKSANITLTRPRRGLFVRAGDGLVRKMTPRGGAGANNTTTPSDDLDSIIGEFELEPGHEPEPVVRRTVQVHVDDVLCLSVENCSFNLPHEETPSFDADDGWAYDPQLTPRLPPQIPASRLCAGMACLTVASLSIAVEPTFNLLYSHIPEYWDLWPDQMLLMFDVLAHEDKGRSEEELTTPIHEEVFWDRFGDRYARLPWLAGDLSTVVNPPQLSSVKYRLAKLGPETNDIRDQYLRSALLPSPKRPARMTR
ncbi:hypothetical protein F4680DRAFT_164554 [Xylaria scruposa]|nr:hypothetical protein F4680DRAFT_164554 [Xylaria scruposa]